MSAPGPEGPDDRDANGATERERLIEDLLRDGHAVEDVQAAARAQRLALLPVQRVLRGTPTLSTADLVERTGVDPLLLERVLQAAEVPIPTEHERVWEERDQALPRLLRTLSELGVSDDAQVELAGTLGGYAARIGSAAIIGLGSSLTREGDTERDLARRITAAAAPVNEHLADVMGLLIRSSALDQLQGVQLDADVIADGRLAGATPVTVGFADVVGFTRMGEQLGAERLRDVAVRLGQLGAEVCSDGVRVIKTIGDAVMLAGPRPLPVVVAMIELQERVAADDDFPRIRAGVATGDAVPRAGDWFGPPVNRASRVCTSARPGSVLADDATRRRIVDPGLDWTPVGRVHLKGVGRVPLHRVRRGEARRWRAGVHPAAP